MLIHFQLFADSTSRLMKGNQSLKNGMRNGKLKSIACMSAAACLLAGCANQPAPVRVAFAKLAINGQPVHMVLDTGASSTVLYNAAANRVGLNFAPPRHDVVN